MRVYFLILNIVISFFVMAHEGHEEKRIFTSESVQNDLKNISQEGLNNTWSQSIGSFHLILLHFPIALINMLAVSEVLLALFRRPIFEFSSKFLVISAAILSLPTAVLGFIFSYSASYEGVMQTFLFWHMCLGILTAITAISVAIFRESLGVGKIYYGGLFLLFLLVNLAGFFGGKITFGPYF